MESRLPPAVFLGCAREDAVTAPRPGCLRSLRRWAQWGCLATGLAATGVSPCRAIDFTQPWNPSAPLPQFITHDYVDPAAIAAIAKYRSGVGHPFSDNYEANDRSLKYYFEPLKKYLNTELTLPLFAPATGTIASVAPEEQVLSNGDIRGSQVTIDPDGYPAFEIRLFHVDLAAGLGSGAHVNAGDPIGYADIRESVDFDLAVGAAWNATQLYPNPGQSTAAPGYRLLSPADLMTDAIFGHFVPYGITDRTQMIVPLAYRNANPGQFGSEDLYNFDPTEYAVFLRPPDFGSQPASVVVNPGLSGYFSAVAAPQGAPLSFQWYRNGVPIFDSGSYAGTATSNLGFYSASAALAGTYAVVATNPYGSTTSDPAVLTVLSVPVGLPVITAQPVGQTVYGGSNVTLSVGATGYSLNYQWALNGGYLFGATSPTLALTAVGAGQAGTYTVYITNPAGGVGSAPAVLNVIVLPPVITGQPSSVAAGENTTVNFSVSASGSGLVFQWYKNGVPLSSVANTVITSNATSSTLTLFDVNSVFAGSYTVSVSNTAGSVTSGAAALTLANPGPSPGPGDGGGGGGAPSLWFYGALAILAGFRRKASGSSRAPIEPALKGRTGGVGS